MPGKQLDFENGEPVDSPDDSDDDRPLPDKRCPLCGWTGTADAVAEQWCPRCDYGVVSFDVQLREGDDGE